MEEEQGANPPWQEAPMTTFFLLVCSVSVAFFLVFLWQCGKPRRPPKTLAEVHHQPEMGAVELLTGRRTLAHLESQMESFLASHQRSTSIL